MHTENTCWKIIVVNQHYRRPDDVKYDENQVKASTVFTQFVPHPRIVPYHGSYYSKGLILVSGTSNCIAPLNSTYSTLLFCKHLLLVLPYLKYSYPSQCK